MSVSTVITSGFGTFGNIPFVVTFGYSLGAAPPPPAPSQRYGPAIWWRCRDDEDEYCERLEEADKLRREMDEKSRVQAEIAILEAVALAEKLAVASSRETGRLLEQMRRSQQLFAAVTERINDRMATERANQLWQAEVERRLRIQEQDDEDDFQGLLQII